MPIVVHSKHGTVPFVMTSWIGDTLVHKIPYLSCLIKLAHSITIEKVTQVLVGGEAKEGIQLPQAPRDLMIWELGM
jgi:hypothetical protein